MQKFPALAVLAQLLVLSAVTVALAESQMLDEISVRAKKLPPKEETLSIMEVRESSARDVGEALSQVEGMSYVRKGAIANDVVLRGMQRDNINVLVDGARLHGACPSRMDPPSFHYDFAEVDKIRIVKGPYDVENPGTLAGIVEVKTKSPEKGIGAGLNLLYGTAHQVNGSATASYAADKFDILLGYAYKASDVPNSGNGKLITDIYPSSSTNRYRLDSIDSRAYEMNTGWIKAGVNPTANSRSEIGYSRQDADHVLYPYLLMDADYDRTNRVNWSYKIEKISDLVKEISLSTYWNNVDHLMNDAMRMSSTVNPTVTARGYSMQTDAETRTYGAKLATSLAIGSGTLKSGIDYYNRNWDALNQRAMYMMNAPLNMIPDVNSENYGLYAEYELPITEKFTVRSGVRGDHASVETGKTNPLVQADSSRTYDNVGGNIQLVYLPQKSVEIFTGFGRSTRIPDAQELYISVPGVGGKATWSGNPGLDATVNNQGDLGVKFSGEGFIAKASIFYSDMRNYINANKQTNTLKSYQNIHATLVGGEAGGQLALPFDLFLKGALSYTDGRNETNDSPLSEMPPLRGSVAVRYDNGTLFAEIAENLARKQNRVDSGLGEQQTSGWETTDLKAGVNYSGITVMIGVDNFFDRQYMSHLSYQRDPFGSGVKVPENGRNVYFSAGYKF